MHVLGTTVPRCLGVARSAWSPKGAQGLGCSLTPGLRIAFRRVTCMARAASVPGLWTLGFLLLRGACVWVLGCRWVRVSAAPRHSWLGCWGVCVLVCLFRLYPGTPGSGVRRGCVCLGSGVCCAPPFLAGVLSCVCACVRAPLVRRHSWLGCAVWVFVLGLGIQLHPVTPGWGVGVCVCLCACPACTPPLLGGMCGVGVVLVFGSRLQPATPGWGVWVCVCLCARPACTPPLLARVCGVGVCVSARVSAAPSHAWLGCCCVRVCVCAPLVPRHSWLGRAAWVCVFEFGFMLRPTPPGWGVGVCVWWCGRSPCTPPLLTGVCGAGVGVWARVTAAPRHSWLGCAMGVCVFGLGFQLRRATPGWGAGVCLFVCVLP